MSPWDKEEVFTMTGNNSEPTCLVGHWITTVRTEGGCRNTTTNEAPST